MLINETGKITEFINELLRNTVIDSFCFGQFYTLVFSRQAPMKYKGGLKK